MTPRKPSSNEGVELSESANELLLVERAREWLLKE
jgi:hypothetical protein